MDLTEAAAIPEVFLTAFQALRWLSDIQSGEWLLLHAGASGVGTAAIQLARAMDAGPVIVTASAPKHALCRKLGAAHCIDYREQDFLAAVEDYSNGRGVDVVIDFIAAPYFRRNLDVLRADGRLVLLALMGGVQVPEVNLAPLLRKRLRIIGSTLRARPLDYKIRLTRELHEFAWPAFRRGTLRPIIDTVFDWTDVVEAHRMMEANENQGKIVLRVG
jgi:NADPH:quinone reductase-like Zn-dependent oxidoreductase